MIELVSPHDLADGSAIAQGIEQRGEGMNNLSLDGTAGAVPLLNAAGVKTTYQCHSSMSKAH